MKSNFNHSRDGLRSEQRAKRRKTNIILNGLIGLVLLLIIIVSFSIFSGDSEEKEKKQDQTVEKKLSDSNEENPAKKNSETSAAKSKSDSQKTALKEDNEADAKEGTDVEEKTNVEDSQVVTEGGGNNVKSTINNPAWEPTGTAQTQPFSDETVDWAEREKALASAIGTDVSNITIWYLGREGENQSIGTVSSKDDLNRTFRVYLEWQDNGGWMPVKVEELIENDKR